MKTQIVGRASQLGTTIIYYTYGGSKINLIFGTFLRYRFYSGTPLQKSPRGYLE